MIADSAILSINDDDFARRFSLRGGNLMWLLGAGASAAAGIPTAGDMIAEFNQQLYISQRRVSPKSIADLSNPAVRSLIQSFIDGLERFPTAWAPDEYAALFEAVYPNEGDRQIYIRGKLSGAKPSYGHIALATLMKADRARIIWTTNFDPLVADACAKVFDSTGHLTSVALDATSLGREALNSQRWPVEIKLHGDFRSRRLKNTSQELLQQDAQLRELMKDACGRSGLIVAGYSGRDDSVMDTLESAMDQPSPFPAGLFWLHRGETPPLPRVTRLLARAAECKVDGGLVVIENFDESLRDLVRLTPGLDMTSLDRLAVERRIWSSAPLPSGRREYPVIRLNAVEVTSLPTICRLITCGIGGVAGRLLLRLRQLRSTFSQVAPAQASWHLEPILLAVLPSSRSVSPIFALHTIEQRRLRYDSQERGLLRSALSAALARLHGLTLVRRRGADLLAPQDVDDARWSRLTEIVGKIAGSVHRHPELMWSEGVAVRLDWADDRPWLLIEPRLVFTGITDENRDMATDFARERMVQRYNRVLNALMAFWARLLAAGGTELRSLDISTGIDAAFTLGRETAFSRRVRA